jgi:hypothetical protein
LLVSLANGGTTRAGRASSTDPEGNQGSKKKVLAQHKAELKAQHKAQVTNTSEYDAWVAGRIANRLSQQSSRAGSSSGLQEGEQPGEQ